jgi:hypothetical protein
MPASHRTEVLSAESAQRLARFGEDHHINQGAAAVEV